MPPLDNHRRCAATGAALPPALRCHQHCAATSSASTHRKKMSVSAARACHPVRHLQQRDMITKHQFPLSSRTGVHSDGRWMQQNSSMAWRRKQHDSSIAAAWQHGSSMAWRSMQQNSSMALPSAMTATDACDDHASEAMPDKRERWSSHKAHCIRRHVAAYPKR